MKDPQCMVMVSWKTDGFVQLDTCSDVRYEGMHSRSSFIDTENRPASNEKM